MEVFAATVAELSSGNRLVFDATDAEHSSGNI